jgi:hypothetical protein
VKLVNGRTVDVHGLDSELLDCLDDNIAALLRHHGVTDVRTPFACQWYFDFRAENADEDDDEYPLPVLKRRPIAEVINETTGFQLSTPDVKSGEEVRFCTELIGEGNPVIIQGDAYLMPWLPYYGREHMNHSFIVDSVDDGLLHVADAYYNKTQWGEAVPTRTTFPTDALRPLAESAETIGEAPFLVLERQGEPAPPDVAGLLRQNAEQIRDRLGERHLLTEFSRFYTRDIAAPDAAGRFTLACWLVARDRALHGRWLADLAATTHPPVDAGVVESFTERVVRPWQRAMEFSYVLERRVRAGRAAPTSTFELIEQEIEPVEVELAGRLLDGGPVQRATA